ncbi:MAG: response regulator, partial [Spartobacteria bacterium]|nr:response regulator [Spartobacteria bacterium]
MMNNMTAPEYSLLVVDDEPSAREGYIRLLSRTKEGRPGKILEAENGSRAMEVLAREPVDCALLDFQMPGGNGLRWLERMMEVQPYLAVIMLTGNGHEEIAVQAMKTGAMDYLIKGAFSPGELVHAIL